MPLDLMLVCYIIVTFVNNYITQPEIYAYNFKSNSICFIVNYFT